MAIFQKAGNYYKHPYAQELNTVSAETSLEMIVAKEPDLIVTITEADYEKYAAIAPTVYIQDGSRSRSIPWAVILQEAVPFCMIYGN